METGKRVMRELRDGDRFGVDIARVENMQRYALTSRDKRQQPAVILYRYARIRQRYSPPVVLRKLALLGAHVLQVDAIAGGYPQPGKPAGRQLVCGLSAAVGAGDCFCSGSR
jgi:hypothetical protein